MFLLAFAPQEIQKCGAGQSPVDTGKFEDISSGHVLRLHECFSGPRQKWTLLSVFPKSWVKFSFTFELLYTPQVQRRGAGKSVSTWPLPILKSIATSRHAKWEYVYLMKYHMSRLLILSTKSKHSLQSFITDRCQIRLSLESLHRVRASDHCNFVT